MIIIVKSKLRSISLNNNIFTKETQQHMDQNGLLQPPIFIDVFVLDLFDLMKEYWTSTDPYPGDPYDHNLFRQYYSDHHPIVFRINY